LRDGFTTLERGLILAAPILAAATTISHFWQKDVEKRTAFADQRSEHLRIELLQHQAKIAALEKKLEARETRQNESRSPTMPAEPMPVRDPFDMRTSMAMFEDPEHPGWPLDVGDHIGDQGCTVTAIERGDRIRIRCPLGSQSITVPRLRIDYHPMGDFPVPGGRDGTLR